MLLESESTTSPDFLIAFGTFLDQKMPALNLQSRVCKIAKIHMNSKNEIVQKKYQKLFLKCIDLGLPHDFAVQITEEVVSLGSFGQPASKRIWCAKVLGRICFCLTPTEMENLVLDKALALCQDTDQEIRCCMSKQLCRIAQLNTSISTRLMPELMELAADEEKSVRVAAFQGIAFVLEKLSSELISKFIVPAWMKAYTDESLVTLVSLEFGKFLWCCRDVLGSQNMDNLFQFFKKLCSNPVEEIRLNCAYNLPAVLKSVGPKAVVLIDTLSKDKKIVRQKVAGCIHVLVEILGSESWSYLGKIFFTLIMDESSIFTIVCQNLKKSLHYITYDKCILKECDINLLNFTFRKLRERVNLGQWRTVDILLHNIECIAEYFPSNLVFDTCVGVLSSIILESPLIPLKKYALRVLLQYTRRFSKQDHREHVSRMLVSETAFDADFKKRMLFLYACSEALECCSASFFRHHFAYPFMGLCMDKVACVRQKWMEIYPAAATALRYASIDEVVLKKWNETTDALRNLGHNLDVIILATESDLEIDKIRENEENSNLKHDAAKTIERKKKSRAESKQLSSTTALSTPVDVKRRNLRSAGTVISEGTPLSGKRSLNTIKKSNESLTKKKKRPLGQNM